MIPRTGRVPPGRNIPSEFGQLGNLGHLACEQHSQSESQLQAPSLEKLAIPSLRRTANGVEAVLRSTIFGLSDGDMSSDLMAADPTE